MELKFWDISILGQGEFYIALLVFGLIGYLIGSINGGQILSRIGSKNLGNEGSKSFGATNAGRLYGTWAFVLVFVFDMFKVVAAALFMVSISILAGIPSMPNAESSVRAAINIGIAFVVVGHIYPIYFGFKGGKGVASAFGAIIVISWIAAIIGIAVFIVTKLVNGWTSIASIAGVSAGGIFAFPVHYLMWADTSSSLIFGFTYSWIVIPAAFVVCILIIWKHKPNLMEFINGEKPWTTKNWDKEKNEFKK